MNGIIMISALVYLQSHIYLAFIRVKFKRELVVRISFKDTSQN